MFVNERALAGTPGAVTMLARLDELASRLAPTADVEGKMRGRLALSALTMATARGAQLGGTDEERLAGARTVARTLLSGASPAQ